MTPPFQFFPALDPAIESALTESIRRFGVLVPVVRDQNGNIIDGHHRARIAEAVNVKYRTDVVTVTDENEAREIAHTLNADRRQLDADQRREVVAALREQGHSLRAIAGAVGVSKSQVANDLEDCPEVDNPERVMRQGGGTYPAKRPTIIAAKDDREADRAFDALASGAELPAGRTIDVRRVERIGREHHADRRRSEQIAKSTVVGKIIIKHGDFRQALANVPDGSVDAIITDPPYPVEFVPLFGDLARMAKRMLKPDGVLVALTGQSHLRDYLRLLDEHLAYRWTGAYLAQGPRTRVHNAKVGTGWKPVLIYQRKDATDQRFLSDDVFDAASESSDGVDKAFHHWGQSEPAFAELVERFTEPGQLVVDPFLGGGTTAVVCRDLGRSFIGCDLDADAVQTSRERVA